VARGESQNTRADREVLLEVEPHRLEIIYLVGKVHITSDATSFCLENGIDVSWLGRNGAFKGRIVPKISRTSDLRWEQFNLTADPHRSLGLAKLIIKAKISNAISVLSSLQSNRTGCLEFGERIAELRSGREKIETIGNTSILLGLEGDAARVYFAALRLGFSGEINFTGRERRPPPDPANALLSFCYVLLSNRMSGLLEARGCDPYIGFLHAKRSGRPSLALDLVEEFRHSIVDRFVLRICNRRQVTADHFEKNEESGGVSLTGSGLKVFFREWEKVLNRPLVGAKDSRTVSAILIDQIENFVAHVRGVKNYSPIELN